MIDPNDNAESLEDYAQEDEDWNRLTTAEFFRGYAESDSIYDDLDDSDSADKADDH